MPTALPSFLLRSIHEFPLLFEDMRARYGQPSAFPALNQLLHKEPALAALCDVTPLKDATIEENLPLLIAARDVMQFQQAMAKAWPWGSDAFCRHSLATGTAAAVLAEAHPNVSPIHALLAGIVHDMGKLVMQQCFGALYQETLMASLQSEVLFTRLEREIFETDHAQVGEVLCAYWQFPNEVGFAVHDHHPYLNQRDPAAALTNIVQQANFMTHLAASTPGQDPVIEKPGPNIWSHFTRTAQLALLENWMTCLKAVSDAFEMHTISPTLPTPDKRPRVYLHVEDPHEASFLSDILLLVGLDPAWSSPALLNEGDWGDNPPGDLFYAARSPSDQLLNACAQTGVAVLNYDEIRHQTPPGCVPRLAPTAFCTWLNRSLSARTLIDLHAGSPLFQAGCAPG